jgi:hypothetical protein
MVRGYAVDSEAAMTFVTAALWSSWRKMTHPGHLFREYGHQTSMIRAVV